MNRFAPIVALLLLPLLSGCETSGANALAGAAAGAALGGIIGGRGHDALRGAAIGAGAGYVIGRVARNERAARERRAFRDDDRFHDDDDRFRDNGFRRGIPPYARPTNRYGFVTSPFPPYNLIDVRGIPHGETVIDPSTGRRFTNP